MIKVLSDLILIATIGLSSLNASATAENEYYDVLVPFQYESVGNIEEGFRYVSIINGDTRLFGMIRDNGETVLPCQYLDIGSPNDELILVKDENGYGYANYDGEIVVPLELKAAGDFYNGLGIVMNDEDKYGYIDTTGKLVVPYEIYEVVYEFIDGLALVMNENGKYGYISETGEFVIPCIYDDADIFSDGLAPVMNEHGKYGYINKVGDTVIPFIYDDAFSFYEGKASVMMEDGLYSFINIKGEEIIDLNSYSSPKDLGSGLYAITGPNGRYGFADKNGILLTQFDYLDYYRISDTLVRVENDYFNGVGLIDNTGKLIVPCKYRTIGDFSEGLISISDEKNTGYIDESGKIVIPMEFESGGSFTNGLASITTLEGEEYFIDKTGNKAFSMPNDTIDAIEFKDGLAAAKSSKTGLYGYIDKNQNVVIPYEFEFADDFLNGHMWVTKDMKWGLIKPKNYTQN